jgi:hypothetical protein
MYVQSELLCLISDINFITSGVEFDLVPFIRFKYDISTRFTGSWCSIFERKYRTKKKKKKKKNIGTQSEFTR